MRTFNILIFQLVIFVLKSQNVIWADQYCGTDDGGGVGIVADASGNVYSTGRFKNTIDMDPGPLTFTLSSYGLYDLYITKTDNNGNLIWAGQVGGVSTDYCYNLTLDSKKNVLITGSFIGTCDFDPGPSVYNLTSSAFEDVFILKLDSNGTFVWAKQISCSTAAEIGRRIRADSFDDVYIVGQFRDTLDADPGPGNYNLISSGGLSDAFICKLSSSGNFVWANHFGGTADDYAEGLSIDGGGNVTMGGTFKGTVDFDPGPATLNYTSVGQSDNFIVKLTNSGNLIWAKRFGGTNFDFLHSVSNDPAGNVFVSGEFYLTVDLDPGVAVYNVTSAGATDGYIQKLDPSGNFIWGRSFGGSSNEITYAMTTDVSGAVYLSGTFYSSGDFDPGPGNYTLINTGFADIFLLKLDVSGNFSWAHGIGSPGGELTNGVCVDAANNIFATGAFDSPLDFDPGPGVNILSACGVADPFVYKVSNPTGTGINEFDGTTELFIFPNPVSDFIIITNEKKEKCRYKIISISGEVRMEGETESKNTKIHISDIPDGIYVIELVTSGNIIRRNIVKD